MIAAPSVLSLDYSRMKEQVEELNASGAQWVHFDVMDGHFVPSLTFGPEILKGFRAMSDLVMDIHLMVTDPLHFSDIFAKAGADLITFHLEAVEQEEDVRALAAHIHDLGCKAGISVKPKTSVETLRPYLNDFDLFLIMSVEPGFGGQKFIPESAQKISDLKAMLKESGSEALIEVDGGVNGETAQICAEAGADVLVAGSYVFKNDIRRAVESLCVLQ